MTWIKGLELPDGYVLRLGKCIDMRNTTLFGLKSHDCYVLMERLLPTTFVALPGWIWNLVIELCQFFKDICSTVLRIEHLDIMEQNISIILCKLECVFPPGWFNLMEHLPIHLVYEAKVGGTSTIRMNVSIWKVIMSDIISYVYFKTVIFPILRRSLNDLSYSTP